MDDHDVDPLPPRSSYRAPAPQNRTSRSPSVSSSVSAESFSRPSQPWLLKRRVLSLDAYASELRRGAAAKEELAREYGGRPVPIPVPLEDGEREAAYEKRFVKWLRDEKRLTLAQLAHEDLNRERTFRIAFAKAQLNIFSTNGAPSLGPLLSKRSRSEDYDNHHNGYDHRDSKRPRDEIPPAAAERLLRKRVIPLAQFKEEQERYGGRQLTEAERLELYGTTTVPITVPLYEGETYQDYERDFRRYLRTVSMDLSRLPDEPNTERSLRLHFATKRLSRTCKSTHTHGDPHDVMLAQRASQSSSASSSRESDATNDHSSERAAVVKSVLPNREQPIAPASGTTKTNAVSEATTPFQFPARCSANESSTSDTTDAQSLLDCGCRQCLLRSARQLISRVATLEEQIATFSTKGATEETQVMDLTKDHDALSSTESNGVKRVDVARMLHITTLVRERRQQRQTQQAEAASSVEDPIEHQLLAQYNEINDRVIANQRALEQAAAQLQDAPLDQIQETSHSQLENRELQALIDEEMGHRNAALAMLLVYMNRHQPQDLEQRIQAKAAVDIPHVQRMCHQKCATVASEITTKKAEADDLTSQLDAVLNEPPQAEYDPDSDVQGYKSWAWHSRVWKVTCGPLWRPADESLRRCCTLTRTCGSWWLRSCEKRSTEKIMRPAGRGDDCYTQR